MLDILKVEQDIELLVCGRMPRFPTPLGAAFGCVRQVPCLHTPVINLCFAEKSLDLRLSPEEYKMALEQEIETQRKKLG